MQDEFFDVFPTSKKVKGYRYASYIILISHTLVPDSDEVIITDKNGYVYKRKINSDYPNACYHEFHKI